jgi:hypothetical protein
MAIGSNTAQVQGTITTTTTPVTYIPYQGSISTAPAVYAPYQITTTGSTATVNPTWVTANTPPPNFQVDDSSGRVAVIMDEHGFKTVIHDLSNYREAAITDVIMLNNQYYYVWDLLCGLDDVRQNGRCIEFDEEHANALIIYRDSNKFADLTPREFLEKMINGTISKKKAVHLKHCKCGITKHNRTIDMGAVTCKRCIRKLKSR